MRRFGVILSLLLLLVRCVAREEITNKGCVWGYLGIPGDTMLHLAKMVLKVTKVIKVS